VRSKEAFSKVTQVVPLHLRSCEANTYFLYYMWHLAVSGLVVPEAVLNQGLIKDFLSLLISPPSPPHSKKQGRE
jgi:hypothetical protein